jgi:hypothetical protein
MTEVSNLQSPDEEPEDPLIVVRRDAISPLGHGKEVGRKPGFSVTAYLYN